MDNVNNSTNNNNDNSTNNNDNNSSNNRNNNYSSNAIDNSTFDNNNSQKTNWCQSVAGIVMKDNKVLLARHTYGAGKGKLIIPGGYVDWNETPQDAARREVMEETGVEAEPTDIIGIRFNLKDWYVIFMMDYIGGTPRSDGNENSEVIFMDINEALIRDDVAELTKQLLLGVKNKEYALKKVEYQGNSKNGPYSLYRVIEKE